MPSSTMRMRHFAREGESDRRRRRVHAGAFGVILAFGGVGSRRYSKRSASVGLIEAARQAGSIAAASATRLSSSDAPAIVGGGRSR
jgi:hypothetical protein